MLANEKYFRDYVVNYTNAAVLLTEDFKTPRTWTGCSCRGWIANTAPTTSRPGATRAPKWPLAAGDRDRPDDDGDGNGAAHRQVRQAGRGEARHGGAAAHRNPDRDETLTSARCVFQVLKRHFARYTPEMVEQACGVAAGRVRQGLRSS